MKFATQSQGRANATYATVKEAVVQQVQKEYEGANDIAKSLEDLQLVDLTALEPVRKISTKTKPEEAAIEQDGFNIKYQIDLTRHGDRVDKLDQAIIKSYSLIMSDYCSKAIQSRIEEHPEFESKLKNNPIATLEVIKTLMHDPVRAQYPMASMMDALTRLLNVRQYEDEDLLDYVK